MSATQELFQIYYHFFQLALRAAVTIASSFDGKTRVADGLWDAQAIRGSISKKGGEVWVESS